ncbi:unnamed protein product [Polarella glacialis]|uniref:Endonuclease/exonuclease/phosphatase domain-containing protein n=1 Tax=Polarella glacialis TaxID=89957 RepID=A0A813GXK3_POLGL|nr:unnamed protein product [Polarella glacialis]CAE8665912.1 unnamed protein product [Polarella glacialis]
MTVFAIYCPCEPQSDAARKAVHAIYDWLHTIIAQLPERTTIVLLGDFNARTGRYNNVMQTSSVGPEYLQQENFNGQQMRYFLDSFNMSALNTWQHTAAGATNISPSGQGSRVDYVCMPRSQKHVVQKLSIWRKAGRLLQVIRIAQPRNVNNTNNNRTPTGIIRRCRPPAAFGEFCKDLENWRVQPSTENAIQQSLQNGTPDSTWGLINGHILNIAKQHFSKKIISPAAHFRSETTKKLHELAQQDYSQLRHTRPLQLRGPTSEDRHSIFHAWKTVTELRQADKKYWKSV